MEKDLAEKMQGKTPVRIQNVNYVRAKKLAAERFVSAEQIINEILEAGFKHFPSTEAR